MGAKAIMAVIVGIAMLGLQACFFPSGGYSNQSGYRYSQPGYEYSQPEYSQQQYGEYGQYPAYRYSQVPPKPQYGYLARGQSFQPDAQAASRHTICDAYGNNCRVCDAGNDRCRGQLP